MINNVSIRLLLIVSLAFFFLFLLKPLRMMIVHEAIVPIGQFVQSESSDFRIIKTPTVGFYVSDVNRPDQKSSEWFNYTGFGNTYFLIGSFLLILLGKRWRSVPILLMTHFVLSTLGATLFIVGLWVNSALFLYAMDFIVSKVVPVFTGYVLVVELTE